MLHAGSKAAWGILPGIQGETPDFAGRSLMGTPRLLRVEAAPTRRRRAGLPHQGTGSYPPLLNGLQRNIRRSARYPPLIAPYFCMACCAYCEQVGI